MRKAREFFRRIDIAMILKDLNTMYLWEIRKDLEIVKG